MVTRELKRIRDIENIIYENLLIMTETELRKMH